jgi:hypothetical protein
MSVEQRQSRVAQYQTEEWFEIDRSKPKFPKCGRCNRPIFPQQPHNECQREVREELAMEKERQRQKQSLETFGEVLDYNEYMIRLHRDQSFNGQETYDNRLVRIEREKKEAHRKMLAQRVDDEKRLATMEYQIVGLRKKVARDKELAEEEAKHKGEQSTDNTTNQTNQGTLQTQLQDHEDMESQWQEHVNKP